MTDLLEIDGCYQILNYAQLIHQSDSIDIDMLDTSFPRFRSSKSAILSQVVAVVVSTGINYLLASNLGLLTRFNTLPERSPTGKVKVVELTPAEKTRVPEAAKADPVIFTPTPATPSSTTVAPFGQGNRVGILPVPSVNPNKNQPKKSNSFKPKTTTKNPNKTALNGRPLAPSKISKPGKLSIPMKTKTALPTSLDAEPSPTPGGKTTPNLIPDSLDDAPTSPTGIPAGNSRQSSPSGTPQKKSDKRLQSIQEIFNQDVQKLKAALGASNIIERPPQRLPLRPYPQKATSTFRCSGDKNGQILVAITIDDQGTVDNSIVPLSSSPELGDKSNNSFIGKALEEADANAQKQHASRSIALKNVEKGKKVLYPFIFEYDAKTC
jgi:hypothetical protein